MSSIIITDNKDSNKNQNLKRNLPSKCVTLNNLVHIGNGISTLN